MKFPRVFSLLLVFSWISFACYADDVLNEIVSAMAGKAVKIELETLQKKYQGQRLSGKGRIISVTSDMSGNKIVNLSLSAGGSGQASVDVIVFLRNYLKERASKFKPGKRVRFSGVFKEILMSSIVVTEGIVK